MSRALLNSQVGSGSGFSVPARLKVCECVIEMIFVAEDIARTQAYATIYALEGLDRPPTQGVGTPEKSVRIGEVRAHVDRATERSDGPGIAGRRETDEAVGEISPWLSLVTRDRAIGCLSDLAKRRVAILPTLDRAPGEANSTQAVSLRVAAVQFNGSVQHVEGVFGARVRVLTVEEKAANKAFPGIQRLWPLPFQTVTLGSIQFRLNAADYVFGNLVLNREDIIERSIVVFRPQSRFGVRLDELPGNPNAVAEPSDAAP